MSHQYYRGKKVLITGSTGFKGSWLCHILNSFGADIYGYSLEPPTDPSIYEIAETDKIITSEIGDIRDHHHLSRFFNSVCPDIVIHMAAQSLVHVGYKDPRVTYETNVMGTVNILECIRHSTSVESFLNVTTDKVYKNMETKRHFVETDALNGFDPYSNSKSCSELVTDSYKNSFFKNGKTSISSARSGNVIGGGDFAKDRIIPDCVRAAISNNKIIIRNPGSVRPYQHVLEPLFAYLSIVEAQSSNKDISGSYNVGPYADDCITTGDLATLFCREWGENLSWENISKEGPHEAGYLFLDNSLIYEKIGFKPHWNISEAVKKTIEWTKIWDSGGDVKACMNTQIKEYIRCE